MKGLTEREKAALSYGYLNPEITYIELFKIAFDTKASDKSIPGLASRWKNSGSCQDYLRGLDAIEENRLKDKLGRLQSEEGRLNPDDVNFSDMDEFLKFAQLKANTTNDEKVRLDYLKIIADLQRFKEQSKTGETEIQRFYTPVLCSECAIYLEAKKKVGK